jgi:hypothetical protein
MDGGPVTQKKRVAKLQTLSFLQDIHGIDLPPHHPFSVHAKGMGSHKGLSWSILHQHSPVANKNLRGLVAYDRFLIS